MIPAHEWHRLHYEADMLGAYAFIGNIQADAIKHGYEEGRRDATSVHDAETDKLRAEMHERVLASAEAHDTIIALRADLAEAKRGRAELELPASDPAAKRIVGHEPSFCPVCGTHACQAEAAQKGNLTRLGSRLSRA